MSFYFDSKTVETHTRTHTDTALLHPHSHSHECWILHRISQIAIWTFRHHFRFISLRYFVKYDDDKLSLMTQNHCNQIVHFFHFSFWLLLKTACICQSNSCTKQQNKNIFLFWGVLLTQREMNFCFKSNQGSNSRKKIVLQTSKHGLKRWISYEYLVPCHALLIFLLSFFPVHILMRCVCVQCALWTKIWSINFLYFIA